MTKNENENKDDGADASDTRREENAGDPAAPIDGDEHDGVDAEFPDEALAEGTTAVRPRRSFLGAAALLLSLVALAGVAYLLLAADPTSDLEFASPDDVARNRQSVESLATSIEALDARMETLAKVESSTESARSRLEATLRGEIEALDGRLSDFDSLPPRVGNLENSVAAIQGIEAGARDALLLAEAEHYLKIANALLTLGGNVELASVALGMADDRVASIGNPALNNVRQAISDSMTALELADKGDMEENAMQLASLARMVDSLPLKPVEGKAETVRDAEDVNTRENPASEAWNAVREAVFSAVKVSRPGGEKTPLLMPGTEPLVRANLALQLQAARLALLRGEQAIFDQSLEDADGWIEQYFDTDSAQVESARATLDEIRSATLDTQLPDISEPLTLLRRYASLSGNAP
jgi:uroporphyrin-3 C-methyltransferase